MNAKIGYQDEPYRKVNEYLGMIHGEYGTELVTPEVVYKLSLMALDELTLSFLGFYEVEPTDLGSVALLHKVQEVVYIDDAVVDGLSRMIIAHDRRVRAGNITEPISPRHAYRIIEYVLHVYEVLNPYLPA